MSIAGVVVEIFILLCHRSKENELFWVNFRYIVVRRERSVKIMLNIMIVHCRGCQNIHFGASYMHTEACGMLQGGYFENSIIFDFRCRVAVHIRL